MPWRRLAALALALALTGALSVHAVAQRFGKDRDGDRGGRSEWTLLGEKVVRFKVDRDVIDLRQTEDWYKTRAFRRLHLVAENNDIHLVSLRLVYMNGSDEDFPVDRLIRAGQDQPVDLRGERKFLKRIELIYRSRPSVEGRAVMKVYGERARSGGPRAELPPISGGPGGGGEWSELGCKRVSLFGVDSDAIEIGRREGRFKALRLSVQGADIQILDLKVVYGNGAPDHIPVRSKLRQGDRTRPLDLRGRGRFISRIEMTYVTIPNFKGQARVCAEGLQ